MKLIKNIVLLIISLQSLYVYADSKKFNVIVVGAGISGLAAAKSLHESGYEVTILEAKNRYGGRINTNRSLGVPLDMGANWIHDNNAETNPLMTIKKELGLETIPMQLYGNETSFAFFDINGNLIKLSSTEWKKVQNRIGIFAYLASYFSPSSNMKDVVYFVKRLGLLSFVPDAILKAIIQIVELEEADDVDKISVASLFQEVGGDEEVIGGFDQITDYFAKDLNIILNSPVNKINYSSNKIEVFTKKTAYTADAVIVTVSLGVLKKNLIKFIPELPKQKENAIQNLGWGNVNKVFLKFPYKFWGDELDYFFIENHNRSNFSWWLSNEPITNEPILSAYISGNYSRELELQSDDFIIEEAINSLRRAFGNDVPHPESHLISRWGLEPYILGSYSYTNINHTNPELRDDLAETVDGKLFFAGDATTNEMYAYTHSALLSGLREAKKIKEFYPIPF